MLGMAVLSKLKVHGNEEVELYTYKCINISFS